jgi:hypothetical protein
MELIKVTNASYVKDFIIHFKFNNGVEKDINLEPELWGEVFEPLKDINSFKNFKLNSWTIEWENGADFSPEFLYNQLNC